MPKIAASKNPRSPRRLISLAAALSSAVAALSCVADGDPTPFEVASNIEYPPEEVPPLTADEKAEAARRLVARIEVEDLGAVSIVNFGTEDDPDYNVVTVGGDALHDVMLQLQEQDATPAEVFATLSTTEELPTALALDHEIRAASGDAQDVPRRLSYAVFRTSDTINSDCSQFGGGHQTFSSWVDEVETALGSYWYTPNFWSVLNQTDGTFAYSVGAGYDRFMTVCDAKLGGDPVEVGFQGQTPYLNWVSIYTDTLSDYQSARTYSSDGYYVTYRASVTHGGPSVRAYIAYGNNVTIAN